MPRRLVPAPIPILLMLGLAGCTVGPDFTPPDPELPPSWAETAKPAEAAGFTSPADPDPRWWTSFGDSALSGLIERANAANPNLQQAVLRIVAARQQVLAARAAGLPSLNGNASYKRQQLGLESLLEQHHVRQQLGQSPQAGAALDQVGRPADLYQTGFDASWELDLFGRVRREVEQAEAETAVAIETRNDAMVTLEAEVAQAYTELRGAQAETRTVEANIRTAQESLDLVRRLQQQGLGSDLDVENAAAQVAANQAALPQFQQQATVAINRLSVLIGQPPGTLAAELSPEAPVPPPPPVIAVGLPSGLVRRRPDIRQAEARLHAQTAAVGVAVAQLFPDLSLTGNVGLRAGQAKYMADWASLFYAFGPSISLPIFQGGRLRANVRLSQAEQQAAALDYRGKVLSALQEVENALAACQADQRRYRSLDESVAADQRALTLANNRFRHGLESFLQVLTVQQNLVQAQRQLVQARTQLTTDVVSLYKAIGGGWQVSSDEPSVAPP